MTQPANTNTLDPNFDADDPRRNPMSAVGQMTFDMAKDIARGHMAMINSTHYTGLYANLITQLLKGDGNHTVQQLEHDCVETGRRVLLVKKRGEPVHYEITITPVFPPKEEENASARTQNP